MKIDIREQPATTFDAPQGIFAGTLVNVSTGEIKTTMGLSMDRVSRLKSKCQVCDTRLCWLHAPLPQAARSFSASWRNGRDASLWPNMQASRSTLRC